MSWIDGRAGLLGAAALAAAGLSGCAGPAGERNLEPLHGAAVRANIAMQTHGAGAGGELARAFAAEARPLITFAFDDASLDAEAVAILDGQAEWLRAHPGVPMTIVGHTDLVGPERYNYGLGLRRAESARSYLIARGVPAERLLAVESRGEQDPAIRTAGRERLNRRAVTLVGHHASGEGLGLDGGYAARLYDAYQAGRIGATEAEPITVN
jgi:outer membrane protein OmpA-like peptidoglycan-associated protein